MARQRLPAVIGGDETKRLADIRNAGRDILKKEGLTYVGSPLSMDAPAAHKNNGEAISKAILAPPNFGFFHMQGGGHGGHAMAFHQSTTKTLLFMDPNNGQFNIPGDKFADWLKKYLSFSAYYGQWPEYQVEKFKV